MPKAQRICKRSAMQRKLWPKWSAATKLTNCARIIQTHKGRSNGRMAGTWNLSLGCWHRCSAEPHSCDCPQEFSPVLNPRNSHSARCEESGEPSTSCSLHTAIAYG